MRLTAVLLTESLRPACSGVFLVQPSHLLATLDPRCIWFQKWCQRLSPHQLWSVAYSTGPPYAHSWIPMNGRAESGWLPCGPSGCLEDLLARCDRSSAAAPSQEAVTAAHLVVEGRTLEAPALQEHLWQSSLWMLAHLVSSTRSIASVPLVPGPRLLVAGPTLDASAIPGPDDVVFKPDMSRNRSVFLMHLGEAGDAPLGAEADGYVRGCENLISPVFLASCEAGCAGDRGGWSSCCIAWPDAFRPCFCKTRSRARLLKDPESSFRGAVMA
jgi:hypothetical protein